MIAADELINATLARQIAAAASLLEDKSLSSGNNPSILCWRQIAFSDAP